VVFQPHRYTRTKALFDDFTRTFYQSELLLVLPIYSAGEKEIKGIDSIALYKGIKMYGHKEVIYVEGFKKAVSYLKEILKEGDVLITMGAGDVWKVGEQILSELER